MSVAQMTCLYDELATTENRIAFARQACNASVADYNVAISLFQPGSLRV